jgi:ribosomal protein L17
LAKAKAVRPFAEKMITLGKRGDLQGQPSIKPRDGDRRQGKIGG